MSRRFAVLLASAVLSSGCVPVTEPVGDPTDPDKALVGTWVTADKVKNKAAFELTEEVKLKIEIAPEVKGNPKGLMLLTPVGYPFPGGKETVQVYFFVATVGTERYGNLILDADDPLGIARLDKEGAYARWSGGAGRRFLVFRYATAEDGLTLNFGDREAFEALMADEKIARDDKRLASQIRDANWFGYKTPAGWVTKYLEKNGREKLFPLAKDVKYTKQK